MRGQEESCGDSRPRLSASRSDAVLWARRSSSADREGKGRARLQPCRKTPNKARALAPEVPLSPLQPRGLDNPVNLPRSDNIGPVTYRHPANGCQDLGLSLGDHKTSGSDLFGAGLPCRIIAATTSGQLWAERG